MQPNKFEDAILFGRSPFIDKVDVNALLTRYYTIGCNTFGQHYTVDALFCFDNYFEVLSPLTTVYCHRHHKQPADAVKISPVSYEIPFLSKQYEKEDASLKLAWRYFTPSLVINWAILNGFKRLYLVGVDHVETDRVFEHFDGIKCESALTPEAHRKFKSYVYQCAEFIEIYQTNPDVKESWDLPFKDLDELYR